MLLSEYIRAEWWLVAIGFSVMIFVYDEARKFIIRKCPGGNLTTQFSLMCCVPSQDGLRKKLIINQPQDCMYVNCSIYT